jgi:hypothetical protein
MAGVGGLLDVGGLRGGVTGIVFGSDANRTLTDPLDYNSAVLDVSSSVSLTATRDLIVPLTGQVANIWGVYNGTSGAQSIRVIGASGTGITIANAKAAIVFCDGTNVRRLTADV